MDHRRVVARLLDSGSREFDVELWDGSIVAHRSERTVAGRIVLRRPQALMALAPPTDEHRAAEAFIEGDVEIVGDTVSVLDAVARWDGPRFDPRALPITLAAWTRTTLERTAARGLGGGRRHSVTRSSRAVRHHYDISDDFYRLFLDPRMIYSCAYFPRGDESLEQAQEAKLDLACRKLNLQPDERLLDVGCGWGGLLAHAAERFGVKATGTTVSQSQFYEARRLAAASQASARIHVLDRDYREISEEPFDKIVSIGMMEHVGAHRLEGYFRQVFRHLRAGGLFLNQAIADIPRASRTVPWLRRGAGGFIEREIFPDGELPPIAAVVEAAERQGFEVRDVECLREHYARTLNHWVTRLEGRFDQATALVGSRRARAWRLYLASSAVAFERGRIGVYQTLLARPTDRGEASGIPRSRQRWYDGTLRAPPERQTA